MRASRVHRNNAFIRELVELRKAAEQTRDEIKDLRRDQRTGNPNRSLEPAAR